jgi:pimeloyl-ACP methyl ester carboxylesterase
VIALDRRSHGDSEDPAGGHTMARHGRDLHNVLTGLGLDDAILVGGSQGASTIWSYVRQRARTARMENAGHAANIEDPDAFNTLMLDFLAAS